MTPMLHALDDFLIDKVHQRVSDALSRYVSCYGIAGFLYVGGFLGIVVGAGMSRAWFAVASAGMIWFPYQCSMDLDKAAPNSAMPAQRLVGFVWRIVALIACPPMVFGLGSSSQSVWGMVWGAAFAPLLSAEYFMACRKNPPKQKRAKVPFGAMFNRGEV